MDKADHDNQTYNKGNYPSDTNPYQTPQAPQMAQPPPPPPSPPPPVYSVAQQVPNYLVPSIIATLCCCMPFGIAAIVFSAQANGKRDAGDYEGALESSKKAKLWMYLAFGCGFLISALWFGLVVLGNLLDAF